MTDIIILVLLGLNVVLWLNNIVASRRSSAREDKLIQAVIANNVKELHHSPKDERKDMKLESALAEKALALESFNEEPTPGVYPVT
ncbi:hypothetical protein LCGC14_0614630 [marine sediment metagenome]|uniref:Uncharacterized protein n=1 Tax=marine sediment metagenome TaxID=412755 RepID=A0A0F9UF32_9ZZZZ